MTLVSMYLREDEFRAIKSANTDLLESFNYPIQGD